MLFQASELPSNPLRNKRNVWSDIEDVEIEADQFINLFLLKNKETGQKVNAIFCLIELCCYTFLFPNSNCC